MKETDLNWLSPMSSSLRSFASDNNSSVDPDILKGLEIINKNHAIGYGDDPYTEEAIKVIKEIFSADVQPFFLLTGTGTNVLALAQLLKPYEAVICAETAHINVDETGAPEHFCGCKLITVKTTDGKLNPDLIKPYLHLIGDRHHSQPKVVSISNATEVGTVYNTKELKALSEFCHENGLFLYCDGARLANAAVYLGVSLKEITVDSSVDVFSLGGAKNGLLLGEVLIFSNKKLTSNFEFLQKNGLQLPSKMRYISSQFLIYLKEQIYKRNADHSNRMAKLLSDKIKEIKSIEIVYPVQANSVFVKLEKKHISRLLEKHFFYIWDEQQDIVRWMTSFDTTKEDIDNFVESIKKVLSTS